MGQTGDKLSNRKRYVNYRSETHQRDKCMSAHIQITAVKHNQFSIFLFYKSQTVHADDVSARLAKERSFIDAFLPKLNVTY